MLGKALVAAARSASRFCTAPTSAQTLLLAFLYCDVFPVGFMVLAMSAVPVKDSVIFVDPGRAMRDPGHSMRVLDGPLHILVA